MEANIVVPLNGHRERLCFSEIFETEDYEKVLIVQPWTTDSNSMQPYSNVVKARIRLPGLPGFLYKRRILKEIGGMIGKISKIDFNTDSRMRGKFARMTVHVNFDKPLTSQVLINDTLQWVEFESLPLICFGCGRYDHLKDVCPNSVIDLAQGRGRCRRRLQQGLAKLRWKRWRPTGHR
ncbi:hypothetical protein Gorai_019007 [Gossypium raimondii]|uniref:CCHC-type domain-containing protein n=1 Tax=Gossypium raimondii TaxID=29730 RepID=A0A7J8PM20_GOSRA|nr:hypothetical protein [Gossypium raimondii]